MKNKIKLTLIALSTFIVGCTTGGYDSPDDFSDVGFYTSEGTSQILEKNIYDYMTFADLSLGEVKHAWTIQTGNAFLKGPIERVPNNIESLIINDGDTVSNAKTVSVLFRKSGLQKVRLYNEFRDSVAFRGHRNGEDYEMASVQVGNKWVIDTTFVVKVYDTIIAELEVRQDGVVVNHKSTDTIYVEAGGSLNFIDKTTIGEPTGRNFFVRRPTVEGDPNSGQNVAYSAAEDATMLLKKLGVFEGGITANRTGETTPGDSDTYVFPAPIKVIPSTQPFQLTGNVIELENETIRIPFNGEFVEATGKESFFEVKVNGVVFDIESVTVNEADATFLDIKLVEPIYRPDVITVTMKEGSGLVSTDTREPITFTDETVQMHNVNLIHSDISGLETGMGWKALTATDPITVTRSDEVAATGTYSLKVNMDPGIEWYFVTAKLPAGLVLDNTKTYKFSYKVYVDASTTVRPGTTGFFLLPDWGQKLWGNVRDVNMFPEGVWKERSIEISPDSLEEVRLRFGSGGDTTTDAIIYMDDFFLQEIETRP
ncbi:hypothetical protein FHR24_000972 [Wenyingzhuangia heitensis]|uniref:DUF5689 domain-containing protein n=1 Tax=Wenyingzhuangia heitensis TaxID=1487859 RepID=A0ABX0U6Q9_9FLAO|nr:hypothetical protein [Wenyingzhuangia heitensis]NIJ44533.1 hypothetical protein [Wenyingzhuangia heitensis]